MSRTATQPRFYRPELDGLRFYAFLGVFVCHALPNEAKFYSGMHLPMPWLWAAVVRSGAAGVDLFFVLSAFLITSLLLRERQETGKISLRLFYIRRILRIWPLYFLVVVLGVMLAHTPPGTKHSFWYYDPGVALAIRCRLHIFRRQLGLRCLGNHAFDLRSAVDRVHRGAVLFGLARADEDAPASWHDYRRNRYLPVGDDKPTRSRVGRCERRLRLLWECSAL